MRENNRVKSVERGLNILEVIGDSPMPLTLTEIADRTGLTRTTAQRFIHTLYDLGYLNRDRNKRYTLGTKTLSFGFRFLNTSSLISMAKPYLDELSSELEMTINLAVLDDCDVLVLYRSEVGSFLKFDVHAGSKLLVYGSALGRVLLAALDDDDMKKRLNKLTIRPLTEKTIVSKQANLAEILNARKNGYVISDRELTMDLCSIAVPVNNKENKTVAAVNLSIDVMRLTGGDVQEKAKKKLIEKGRLISRNFGYNGPYPKIVHR